MRRGADVADFLSEESSKHEVADSIAIRIRVKTEIRASDLADDSFMKRKNPECCMRILFDQDRMGI